MRKKRTSWALAIRIPMTMAFVLANLVAGGASSNVLAQGDVGNSYVLETTGQEITWAAPWELVPDITEVGDGVEVVGFSSDVSSLLISVLPNGLDLEQARDTVLEDVGSDADSYAIVDRGAYENISYALDIATYDTNDLGVFTVFRGGTGDEPTFVYVFISGISSFATDFGSAQDVFRVDDSSIFNGVEGQGLQDLLAQNAGSGGEPGPTQTATEEATSEPTEEATSEPTEEATSEATGESPNLTIDKPRKITTTKPTPDSTEDGDEIPGEYVDLGLISQGEYESPQFESSITWDDSWAFDLDNDPPASSDTEQGVDSLALFWQGDAAAFVTVSLFDAGGATPRDFVTLWTSDQFLADTSSPDAEVLLSDSSQATGGVVVRDFLGDGTEFTLYREARLLDGGRTVGLVTYVSSPVDTSDALADASAGIEIDGDAVFSSFDADEESAAVE